MPRGGRLGPRVAAVAALACALLPAAAAADHRETFLVSRGDDSGVSPRGAGYLSATGDGSRVYFATQDVLAPEDQDANTDIYARRGAVTELVSAADPGVDGGRGTGGVSFGSATADGSRVFFITKENLTHEDSDFSGGDDVYLRDGDETKLVSRSTAPGFGFALFQWCGTTDDGGRAFFRTTKGLAANDFDNAFDVYAYTTATNSLELVSVSSTGQNPGGAASCAGFTSDGTTTYFSSPDRLHASDTDSLEDVYARSGGTTTLVTADTPGAAANAKSVSADGQHVIFESTERLVPEDVDDQKDVYERTMERKGEA